MGGHKARTVQSRAEQAGPCQPAAVKTGNMKINNRSRTLLYGVECHKRRDTSEWLSEKGKLLERHRPGLVSTKQNKGIGWNTFQLPHSEEWLMLSFGSVFFFF